MDARKVSKFIVVHTSFTPALLRRMVLMVVPLIVLLMLAPFVGAPAAEGQTYRVLHTFSGKQDGGLPVCGLALDRDGNLYGTTSIGGVVGSNITGACASGCGVVFAMVRSQSGWVLRPIHTFNGHDGGKPTTGVIFGSGGELYGTTEGGGGPGGGDWGAGTAFRLDPPVAPCRSGICGWRHTVLHRFSRGTDGILPSSGPPVLDEAGNLYGTTAFGGYGDWGTVYQLSPAANGWNETILFSFSDGADGSMPNGVVFDHSGALVGTTNTGGQYNCSGDSCGTVFRLAPSETGLSEQVLHHFQGGDDGYWPRSAPIVDQSGDLIGTTINGGVGGGGTLYTLSLSGGGWTFATIYNWTGFNSGPADSLVMDAAGNLYGTTFQNGAYGWGNVFKLTRWADSWLYTSIYDFTGGSDGGQPSGRVVLDSSGNLYGTAEAGGRGTCNANWMGCGVVWEITP